MVDNPSSPAKRVPELDPSKSDLENQICFLLTHLFISYGPRIDGHFA